jgi:hypothetical protein
MAAFAAIFIWRTKKQIPHVVRDDTVDVRSDIFVDSEFCN